MMQARQSCTCGLLVKRSKPRCSVALAACEGEAASKQHAACGKKKVNDALLVRWLRHGTGEIVGGLRPVVVPNGTAVDLLTDAAGERLMRLLCDCDETVPRRESLRVSEVAARLRELIGGGEEGSFLDVATTEQHLYEELLAVAQGTNVTVTEAGLQDEGMPGNTGADPFDVRAEELADAIDGAGTSVGTGTRTDPHPFPAHGTIPLSEFRTRKGLEAAAFPTLFPFGRGGFADERPIKTLEWSTWCQHLMQYYDGRFAQHRRFRYYLLNVNQRHTAIQQAALFVRSEAKNLTVGQVRALSNGDRDELRRKCDKYSAPLRNSAAFFNERKGELKAMCDQLGDPHVFATHSHADTHCEYLQTFIKQWVATEFVDCMQWEELDPFAPDITPEQAAARRVQNLQRCSCLPSGTPCDAPSYLC